MFKKSTTNSLVVTLALLFMVACGLSAQDQVKVKLSVKRVTVDARMIDSNYSMNYIIVPEESLEKSQYLETLSKYTKNALNYLKMEETKKGKLKVFIGLQIVRDKKMEVTYTIRAFENDKEKWRVSAGCSAKHNTDVNEIFPALVASALFHIGQDKNDKAFVINKYPQYINTVMK